MALQLQTLKASSALKRISNLKPNTDGELSQAIIWVAAFTGVSVLVGLGKIKPESLEMLLFALIGRASIKKDNSHGAN